ncbi:MAG TPA: dihydrofolate reductase family protein [Pseudonocardiaceae bacterium]|jgi:dihydrofolate reductase|nr:dihydrofolate reductase family protein [Pseudonocardiaceae bacterium]
MTTVVSHMSMSLDGFVTGPNASPDQPLGAGGRRLHDWLFDQATERDAEMHRAMIEATGATVMGRRSYDQAAGDRGWGDGGPLGRTPCFVLSHSVPERISAPAVFTFVSDGIASAIDQAGKVAGDREVSLHGATALQQALRVGLVDQVHVHLVPILLGGGVRLFDHLGPDQIELERTEVVETAAVTHLRFRVLR